MNNFILGLTRAAVKVSTVFCIVMMVLLALQYRRLVTSDPLEAPELEKLRVEFSESKESGLRDRIRDLDFVYRRAWFAAEEDLRVGGWMLLAGAVALACASQLGSFCEKKRINFPDKRDEEDELRQKLLLEKVVLGGALTFAVVLMAASYWPEGSDGASEEKVVILKPTLEELRANWVSFRGFNGLGKSDQHHIPASWDGEKMTNIQWKVPLNLDGFSSPLIWKGQVILTGGSRQKREIVSYNLDKGTENWRFEVPKLPGAPVKPPKVSDDTGYAASTPATDGAYIYAAFATGDLVCVDFTGKMIWAKNLGLPKNPYGYSSSMLVADGKLVVQYDDEDNQVIYAFNSDTGTKIWETRRKTMIGWSSPVLVEKSGKKVIVTLTCEAVEGFDLTTGKQLWMNKCMNGEVAPSAAFDGENIYVANDNACAAAIEPITGKTVWQNEDVDLPDVSSPLILDSLVYLFTSGGIVVCLDAKSGEMLWDHEVDEGFYSSAVLVSGKIVAIDMAGIGYVIEPNREEFVELSKNPLGERMVATPAFVGKSMILRGVKHLFHVREAVVK